MYRIIDSDLGDDFEIDLSHSSSHSLWCGMKMVVGVMV